MSAMHRKYLHFATKPTWLPGLRTHYNSQTGIIQQNQIILFSICIFSIDINFHYQLTQNMKIKQYK